MQANEPSSYGLQCKVTIFYSREKDIQRLLIAYK